MIAPITRIILRYGVGTIFGMEVADLLAGDPDVILLVATVIGIATEVAYAYAKKRGWAT